MFPDICDASTWQVLMSWTGLVTPWSQLYYDTHMKLLITVNMCKLGKMFENISKKSSQFSYYHQP